MTARELQDRLEIHDVVLRYCRAIDRGDFEGVRGVYAADGIDHHTGFDGSADDYVALVRERLESFTGTMHLVGNHLAEITGDHAVAETYGTAVHWGSPAEDARVNFTSGFRYLDHLRRDEGVWRIAERWAVREWTRSEAGRFVPPEGPGPRGSRGPADPLFALRERVRDAGGRGG